MGLNEGVYLELFGIGFVFFWLNFQVPPPILMGDFPYDEELGYPTTRTAVDQHGKHDGR